MEGQESTAGPSGGRGRGRGKSRGGLGKYLRARGRGGGRGRGAVWSERLKLEDEQEVELDEEDIQELQQKFGRRQLGTNADRYAEEEPELDSDGEPLVEPEVDLSSFLARQRLADDQPLLPQPDEDDDIDTSLPDFTAGTGPVKTKKGKVQQVEWDASLEEMSREKAAADATRDLKARFRAHTANERTRIVNKGTRPKLRGMYHYL